MLIRPPSSINPSVPGSSAPGQLFHMARSYFDGSARMAPAQSLEYMLRDSYIAGQATKGYFARPEGVRSVSFTATGIEGLSMLVKRRSEFGICFERRLIDPQGTEIRPVHYLDRPTIDRIQFEERYPPGLGPRDRHWIDLEEPGVYSFSWENEWRKLGDLFFDHAAIAFIIAPLTMLGEGLLEFGLPVIPSYAVWDPKPHRERIAQLIAKAESRLPEGVPVDRARFEEEHLAWLAGQFSSLLYADFYPKIRSEMRRDEEREIYTDSGELRDPDGEWSMFEASMFDQDNTLDEIFEDSD